MGKIQKEGKDILKKRPNGKQKKRKTNVARRRKRHSKKRA